MVCKRVYVYLFAKKDQENIEDYDLEAFKKLANTYRQKSDDDMTKELEAEKLLEICI